MTELLWETFCLYDVKVQKKKNFDNKLPVLLLGCFTLCFKQSEIEKRCSLSVLTFHDTTISFPSHGKSHTRERIYRSTTCSYFEMTNTVMKQKKFPIKINHMSDFSWDSASSQLRKCALAVNHGVNTYLLCPKWPVEKQTEIWASTGYENKQPALGRHFYLMF